MGKGNKPRFTRVRKYAKIKARSQKVILKDDTEGERRFKANKANKDAQESYEFIQLLLFISTF